MSVVDILDSLIYTDVGTYIVATLPGIPVVQGYPNRVSMLPATPGFIEMFITRKVRQNTNIDGWDVTNPAPADETVETHYEVVMQLSFFGAQSSAWATIISNLWRDELTCVALADTCQPLFSEDPIRAPLVNEEQQYEDKWIVLAHLQYNPVVSTPQQFADTLGPIDVINVYEAYPP